MPNPLDLAAVQSVLARSNTDYHHLVPEDSLVLDSSFCPNTKNSPERCHKRVDVSYATGVDPLL